jgi:hypothetical protein
MQTQYFFERQIISQLFIFSAEAELLRVVQLESMPGYKYPNIDSGATPIGSAAAHPIEIKFRGKIRQEEKTIGAYDRLQVSDHSLGANPIGSTGRAPDEKLF